MEPSSTSPRVPTPDAVRAAEVALARLGYQRVTTVPPGGPNFWVQEVDVPKRTFPVFLWDGPLDEPVTALNDYRSAAARAGTPGRAIVVVPSERAAEAALDRGARKDSVEAELAVLVVPTSPASSQTPRFHAVVLPRREVLDLATGIVVGLFRRAQA
ncbi:MAG: hypothetical protein L3K08_05895, partial [Thermoplasmata archaeon]|nr:hypothetical protein [Thermoplasmata archaeon]